VLLLRILSYPFISNTLTTFLQYRVNFRLKIFLLHNWELTRTLFINKTLVLDLGVARMLKFITLRR